MDAVVSHTVYLNYNYFVKSCEYNKKLKSYNSTYMYIGHYWIKRMVHALLKGSYSQFVKEEQYVYIEQNRELDLTECEMTFRRKKYPYLLHPFFARGGYERFLIRVFLNESMKIHCIHVPWLGSFRMSARPALLRRETSFVALFAAARSTRLGYAEETAMQTDKTTNSLMSLRCTFSGKVRSLDQTDSYLARLW